MCKPGNRNKNRKTSENGGFDAPCCENTTTNNLPVKTLMRKKIIAWFSECRTEAWYGTLVAQFGAEFTSRVIQTAAFSGTSTVNLQAGMVLCALGHQHMQRAHFWARKVLVDVGCTVPNKHKWEIRTNTVCG